MAANPLSAGPLASLIASSLPSDAEPQLKNTTEAVAIACHAGFLSVGFKLVGLGDDHRLETPSSAESPQPLPSQWNEHSSSGVAFRYSHPQSSMQFLLKISGLGAKTVVYGIGIGHDKTTSFDLTTKDYTSESSFPSSPTKSSPSPEDAAHSITTLYISPSRLTDLGSTLKLNIIQKLVPSLQKEGYEEAAREDDRPPRNPNHPAYQPPTHDPRRDEDPYQPARPHPLADPAVGPRRPVPAADFPPPGFEDPYDIHRGPRGGAPGMGIPAPPRYGERDLYPPGMGPRDPLAAGPPGGGGMYMDFEDLRGGGGLGGPGGLQRPPGARWDPTGPTGDGAPFDPLMGDQPPRRGPGGFGGGGGGPRFGGPGGAPPNPFGGFGSGDFI